VCLIHCVSKLVCRHEWEEQGYDEHGPLADVIGSLDTVHGPILDFAKGTEDNKKYFSVAYDCPCHKWQCVVGNSGKILFLSPYGMAGSTHDGSAYMQEKSDLLPLGGSLLDELKQSGKFLIADRIYEGYPRLLTPYKGVKFTLPQKKWNYAVSERRALVENSFTRFKNFSILKHPFRGQLNHHRKWGHCVGQMINADLQTRPLRARAL